MKRLQNKAAESRFALPIAAVYAVAAWLAGGVLTGHLWVQFTCFAVSTYLIMEMNTANALIRIYSRMVSVAFVVLSSAMAFLMPSASGAIAEMCFVATLSILLRSYQDHLSTGKAYYAFVSLSLGSIFCVHLLYYIPVIWLAMFFHLQSMSWRAFFASVLGVLTPYWFASLALFVIDDPSVVAAHFGELAAIEFPPDYASIGLGKLLSLAFLAALAVMGTVHFMRTSHNDSIRIRMVYAIFILLAVASFALVVAMPARFDLFIRILLLTTCPLIAHFIALTHTRITNIAFYAICATTIALTAYNLWTRSYPF